MGAEEHVMARAAPGARRGYALAATVALIFLMTVILGVAVSHLDYSYGVMDAWLGRVQARNALESMTNLSFKWLSAEVNGGVRPRSPAVIGSEYLTDYDSLRIFASSDYDGCEVRVYDLDYAAGRITKPIDTSRMFPPSFPGGYMIRATAEKKGFAPLTLESVYVVVLTAVSGDITAEILDSKPVYSREIFRK